MRLTLNPLVKIFQESFTLGIEPNSRRSILGNPTGLEK